MEVHRREKKGEVALEMVLKGKIWVINMWTGVLSLEEFGEPTS